MFKAEWNDKLLAVNGAPQELLVLFKKILLKNWPCVIRSFWVPRSRVDVSRYFSLAKDSLLVIDLGY